MERRPLRTTPRCATARLVAAQGRVPCRRCGPAAAGSTTGSARGGGDGGPGGADACARPAWSRTARAVLRPERSRPAAGGRRTAAIGEDERDCQPSRASPTSGSRARERALEFCRSVPLRDAMIRGRHPLRGGDPLGNLEDINLRGWRSQGGRALRARTPSQYPPDPLGSTRRHELLRANRSKATRLLETLKAGQSVTCHRSGHAGHIRPLHPVKQAGGRHPGWCRAGPLGGGGRASAAVPPTPSSRGHAREAGRRPPAGALRDLELTVSATSRRTAPGASTRSRGLREREIVVAREDQTFERSPRLRGGAARALRGGTARASSRSYSRPPADAGRVFR